MSGVANFVAVVVCLTIKKSDENMCCTNVSMCLSEGVVVFVLVCVCCASM